MASLGFHHYCILSSVTPALEVAGDCARGVKAISLIIS